LVSSRAVVVWGEGSSLSTFFTKVIDPRGTDRVFFGDSSLRIDQQIKNGIEDFTHVGGARSSAGVNGNEWFNDSPLGEGTTKTE